jgi:PAS domain S-box-containing protein
MPEIDDIFNRLETEINLLKSRIAELEKNQLSNEDKLKLAIIERCPFTVWACDRNFRIVLWNSVCEQVYGFNAKEALGADYADLFVDPVEEEQSREDCIRIIDKDVVFRNFLAYDHSANGRRQTMLTNCFRIWDDERQEYLQAEVALEISDLQLRIDEHRTLREVGVARLEQQKKMFDLKKSELISRLAAIYATRLGPIDQEQHRLDEYRDKLAKQKVVPEKIKEISKEGQQRLDIERKRIEKEKLDITSRIVNASTPEELDAIEIELSAFMDEAMES